MALDDRFAKALLKKAHRGFNGYPIATVAYYGPDDRRASKVAVSVLMAQDEDIAELRRWFSEHGDVRRDATVQRAILEFIRRHDAQSVAIGDGIMGCPHEEGIDYPDGEACPQCPFWAGRKRPIGKLMR
ncbi:hypothetical protein FHP25_37830 [Vineibacter terrae]|uniref:Uncharacterized protein n=1 Tax=Vineibacter terrae TaxID=2586908 RepID=A0A5C8P7I4_9HYPH|nr:hypothetical protein [Vineibacter terrae]TXL69697.1 hypothetical protein FHP25_37830 [Vineibacter terrae]